MKRRLLSTFLALSLALSLTVAPAAAGTDEPTNSSGMESQETFVPDEPADPPGAESQEPPVPDEPADPPGAESQEPPVPDEPTDPPGVESQETSVSDAPTELPDVNAQEPFVQAVYLGVEGYGTVKAAAKSSFVHKFSVDGGTERYQVASDGDFALQNMLAEGYVYDIAVEDGTVIDVQSKEADAEGKITAVAGDSVTVDGTAVELTDTTRIYQITSRAGGAEVTAADVSDLATGETVKVYGDPAESIFLTFVAEEYQAPLSGVPGQRTLKNFLATAMEPVGTALYIYGGAWDWQDVGSSNQATTIGLPQSWVDFFQSHDAGYTYRNNSDYAHSYYPHNQWNQYYFAGVDCSGYVGRTIYNVMNTQDGNEGYVMSAANMAKTFADTYHFGTWTQTFASSKDFKTGDIFSMNSHVWICLGLCKDGSMVILHSTPTNSKIDEESGKGNQPGGGCQLSGVGVSADCQAVQLAQTYMDRYYSAWSERYDVAFKAYTDYTKFTSATAGKFSWNLDATGLTDPDGYAGMSADKILADLFGEETPDETQLATYLGVKDFEHSHGSNKDSFEYLFSVNGATKTYSIANDENYTIQNKLQEGYVYDITVEDGKVTNAEAATSAAEGNITAVSENSITVNGKNISIGGAALYQITSQAGGASVTAAHMSDLAVGKTVKVYGNPAQAVYLTFVAEAYTAPVRGVPGKHTLKNFLATAMEPVGTSLYIYGGAWDWQDVGSSNQATSIGLPQSWVDFFQSHDANFTYRDKSDPAHSYYWRHYNEYYYGGPDCSGYVGWAVYNLINAESGKEGYVQGATGMAKAFADDYQFGTWTQSLTGDGDFKPGDIFSIDGHVWICLGTCEDGSVVFLHSTPSNSITGQPGGGVQISALDPKGSVDCDAYQLAQSYMKTYYSQWDQRYTAVLRDYASYTDIDDIDIVGEGGGRFRWDLNSVLSDPDGYAAMSAEQILADLFEGSTKENVVYLGVEGYGTVKAAAKSSFVHKFSVNGSTERYQVASDGDFAIQNILAEGYVYDITVKDGVVVDAQLKEADVKGKITAAAGDSVTVGKTAVGLTGTTKIYRITSQAGGAEVTAAAVSDLTAGKTVKVYGNPAKAIFLTFVAEEYQPPLSGVPGQRTLKNFLATAMEPVGTALYIYGGSWDWQDVGSSNQATTIGLPQTWLDFFQSHDAGYTYRNNSDPAHSYYPHNEWNQYYFAGVDCSGYVGWTIYNVMNTQSGNEGYVMSSTKMAKTFAENYQFGTWTQSFTSSTDFKTGDIFSMNGHVWICLGLCDDGSMVILHSTTSNSKQGQPGGGSQLSGVGASADCQAVQLAQKYMSKYYPAWSERYDAAFRAYADYTKFTGTTAGKFSWNLDATGLTDPDGYAGMSADKILANLFGENQTSPSGGSGSSSSVSVKTDGHGSVTVSPRNPSSGDKVTMTPAPKSGYRVGSVKVLDNKGNELKVTQQADGTFTYTQPAGKVTVTVEFVEESKLSAAERFDDVAADSWYCGAVDYALANGLMSGTGEHTFSPNADITRGMLITILYSLEENPSAGNPDFSDVTSDDWYGKAAAWAAEKGIMGGYPDGTFGPNDPVTREQIASILYSYAKYKGYDVSGHGELSGFTDQNQVHDWAAAAMGWATAEGLISGMGGGILAPRSSTTRAQAAVILMNFCEKIAK